ncbi:anthranilate synthase component I [Petrocella sp. FN5]|uniref:anthranilate synthase component I n=1 Tax=Petrocella sp. FN5 TaxID=3032002 RepID=UPI0023DAA005|nr:anthranilate synthase component I [Petrocella sp. FN5]MDF1617581.1 anthranilate synthase component I [Petrocella sp. FN5]
MMNNKRLITYEHIIACDTETPITLYSKYVRNEMGFLLESKEQPKGRYSFMACNPDKEIKAYGSKVEVVTNSEVIIYEGRALDVVKKEMDYYDVENRTDLPFVGGAVGSVGYDMIRQYEDIPLRNPDELQTPDLHLMFVTEILAYDHFFNQLHIVVLEEVTDSGAEKARKRIDDIEEKLKREANLEEDKLEEELKFESNISQEIYENAVIKAKKYIYEGDIFQVVLSQRWSATCNTSPFKLYRKLRRMNPSPYMFYFNFQSYYIVGSSPEMLVEMKGNHIKNCPIAGTRKRGATSMEDEELAKDLLEDEKERAEHNMLVDLGRNDMGKIAKIGSVEVTSYMEVQKYSHVMHLVSLVEGEKDEDKDMFEVLMSFLPAGTLSGAPKIRAMEIIDELEETKRGIYGGAIGYFGYNKNMDMCIAIRTMIIKDEKVYIQAGAGIVADSDPTMEYEETRNKAEAQIKAIHI